MRAGSKVVFLVASVAILLSGCRKQPTVEAATAEKPNLPPEENAKIEAELIPAANANPGAPPLERLQGAVHKDLTMRLQMYIDKTGRVPETIYEFANTAVDSMPPAPPGMKYVIDPADKTVKVVRK